MTFQMRNPRDRRERLTVELVPKAPMDPAQHLEDLKALEAGQTKHLRRLAADELRRAYDMPDTLIPDSTP